MASLNHNGKTTTPRPPRFEVPINEESPAKMTGLCRFYTKISSDRDLKNPDLTLDNPAVVSRTHVLIGRVIDGLVQEVDAAVGECELGARGMLRAEAPGVVPVILLPALGIQVATVNRFLLVTCTCCHRIQGNRG